MTSANRGEELRAINLGIAAAELDSAAVVRSGPRRAFQPGECAVVRGAPLNLASARWSEALPRSSRPSADWRLWRFDGHTAAVPGTAGAPSRETRMYLHQIFLSIENSRFEDFPTYAENSALVRAVER